MGFGFGNLKSHFYKSLDDRILKLSDKLITVEKYKSATKDVRTAWDKVLNAMPEEYKGLLSDLEGFINFRGWLSQEYMYKQGFKDSISIFKFFKRLYKKH